MTILRYIPKESLTIQIIYKNYYTFVSFNYVKLKYNELLLMALGELNTLCVDVDNK